MATDDALPRKRLTRRRFLAAAGAVAASAAGVGLYTWRIEPHWLSEVHLSLPIADLPPSLVGRRVIQISDLHAGPVDFDYLAGAMDRLNALRPDLLAITGDFMSCDGNENIGVVARLMERLTPPPLGAFAVLGNHDYARGWANAAVGAELASRLTDLGIITLRNESRSVEGLQIVGIDDLWGPNFAPAAALAAVDWQRPALTFCHNPDAVDLPALANVRGWILSGHTHGGQCKPPFLPPPLLPVRNRRYTQGQFALAPGRHLYINPGLGYLRRVRFNVRPEMTIFTLTRAAQADGQA